MSPSGRRVATFVAACLAFDLYGFAVYRAWKTNLLGPGTTLVLLTIMAVLGIAGLALAPAWLQRANGAVPQPAAEPLPPARPWWFIALLVLASAAGGLGLAVVDRVAWPAGAGATMGALLVLVALNSACLGLLIFAIVRVRRVERFGVAIGVILTIQAAIQLVGGLSFANLFNLRFVFALIQMGVIYMPFCLWAGYLWRRIMTAIFSRPPRH